MADSYETAEALYSASKGIDCSVSQHLNENRVTLIDGEVFTAFGIERIEKDRGWHAEFRTGPYETRWIPLDEIEGFEMVER